MRIYVSVILTTPSLGLAFALIKRMRSCSHSVAYKVTFHFIFSESDKDLRRNGGLLYSEDGIGRSFYELVDDEDDLFLGVTCQAIETRGLYAVYSEHSARLVAMKKTLDSLHLIQCMRGVDVASWHAKTPSVLVLEMGVIPSSGIGATIEGQSDHSAVYVVPGMMVMTMMRLWIHHVISGECQRATSHQDGVTHQDRSSGNGGQW
jgi:hypothetical protein